MTRRSSPPILARLRASTRLIALVLLVFLMKIGMVAACASHDLGDAALAGIGHASPATMTLDTDDGGKSPKPITPGGCMDCHCHQAAALVLEATLPLWQLRGAEPPVVVVPAHVVSAVQELRPPIL